MPTSAVEVDQTRSYARRGAGSYEVVLSTERLDAAGDLQLCLRSRGRRVIAPLSATVAADETRLVAQVPVGELAAGRWRLLVERADASSVELRARLVVGPRQPVALLTGPEPVTTIRPPRGRAGHHDRSAVRTGRRGVGRILRGARARLRARPSAR